VETSTVAFPKKIGASKNALDGAKSEPCDPDGLAHPSNCARFSTRWMLRSCLSSSELQPNHRDDQWQWHFYIILINFMG